MDLSPFIFRTAEIEKVVHSYVVSPPPSVALAKRLKEDEEAVKSELDVDPAMGVYFVKSATNPTHYQALVAGLPNTPFEGALFQMEFRFPHAYPTAPPKVWMKRNNEHEYIPSLSGSAVTTSLLNNWINNGEMPWSSKIMLPQLMFALQSMCFVQDPYYAHVGNESKRGNSGYDSHSRLHNVKVRLLSIGYGILDMIEKPPKGFEKLVRNYFLFRGEQLLSTILPTWAEYVQIHGTKADYNRMVEYEAKFTEWYFGAISRIGDTPSDPEDETNPEVGPKPEPTKPEQPVGNLISTL